MASVSGQIVLDPNTTISTDIRVQAFDQDMLTRQLLGTVIVARPPTSTAPVFYTITYDPDRFLRDDKHTADLFGVVKTLEERLRDLTLL